MSRVYTEGVAYIPLRDAPDLVAPLLLATRKNDTSAAVARFVNLVRRNVTAAKPED
jgi:hypothetical protein